MTKVKVLFVCMGNICRSPTAQAIFEKGLRDKNIRTIFCDSAGTLSTHQGELPDSRSREHGRMRGYVLDHISRPILPTDLEEFDMILAMDRQNIRDLHRLFPNSQHLDKVALIGKYHSQQKNCEIPDPYSGGKSEFELVLDLLEDCCSNLHKILLP